VKAAVQKYGIKYPVLQDNEKKTWNAYENKYWPRKYLIDAEGYTRYNHIGEGNYSETENVIQSLLSERGSGIDLKRLGFNNSINTDNTTTINHIFQSVDFAKVKTPDLYLGYDFTRHPIENAEVFHPGQIVTYTIPSTSNSTLKPNTIYLEGKWKNNHDNVELQSDTGRIILNYSAKSVNLVAGSAGQGIVYEDNSLLSHNSQGVDIKNDSKFTIDYPRLYNIVYHQSYDGIHSLVIDVKGKGFQAYVFTFG
ncbi:MAG: thiol-disulfide isomerase, partial [Candidatus Nitrosocosmicus sp.]